MTEPTITSKRSAMIVNENKHWMLVYVFDGSLFMCDSLPNHDALTGRPRVRRLLHHVYGGSLVRDIRFVVPQLQPLDGVHSNLCACFVLAHLINIVLNCTWPHEASTPKYEASEMRQHLSDMITHNTLASFPLSSSLSSSSSSIVVSSSTSTHASSSNSKMTLGKESVSVSSSCSTSFAEEGKGGDDAEGPGNAAGVAEEEQMWEVTRIIDHRQDTSSKIWYLVLWSTQEITEVAQCEPFTLLMF